MLAVPAVPEICVSPAPPDEPVVEPYSPFSAVHPPTPIPDSDGDSFRPLLLSPPVTASPRFPRQLSPLRPIDSPVKGQGLERERFEELLRASRERNAALGGGKRSLDLRKEIAIKVHKSKQVERRALFLSKVQAPPSPSAIDLPKTPPESPAIFHYSFPSPGLESPLAVFEAMVTEDPTRPPRQTWVEQVDFHMPNKKVSMSIRPTPKHKGKVPSLEEITAHYVPAGVTAETTQPTHGARLPAFLAVRDTAAKRRSLPADVGRLHFPVRSNSPPAPEKPAPVIHAPVALPPSSPRSPKLQITTQVVPRTSSNSPTKFTESNLRAFEAMRTNTAQAMMSRLRHRTLPPNASRPLVSMGLSKAEEEKKMRRRSAPPELTLRERRGFTKPPLNLPGAF